MESPTDYGEVERQIEQLSRMLGEMRPPSRAEARLGSIVVTDRIDRFGRYHHIDPEAEAVLGFPPSYYTTEIGWVRFNHPDDRWRTAILWQRALAGRPCRALEYRTYDTEGRWVWLEDSLRPVLFDRDGHARVVQGRWRDITPRKRREIEFLLRHWEALLDRRRPPPRPEGAVVIPFPGPAGRRPPFPGAP